MKIGFRTAGFGGWEIHKALRKIREIGYDGVELCLEHKDLQPHEMTGQRVLEIQQTLDDAQLEIASVSYHGDGTPMEKRLRATERAIDVAADFGCTVLIVNTERTAEGQKDEQFAEVASRMSRLAAMAGKRGVTLALEPEPLTVVDDTTDMVALMAAVGSEHLKVNLDVGHAYITDDDVRESIRTLGKSVIHTHFEDIRDKVHKHLIPGHGELPLADVISALEAVGYEGYYTVDLFSIADDPAWHAGQALAGLRRIIENA